METLRFGVIALMFVAPSAAMSAGFALKEQSALALGSAFAGATAGAEDISHIFFNPAALSRFDGVSALAVSSYIRPVSGLEDAASTNAALTVLGGDDDDADIAEDAAVPAVYGAAQLHDRLRIGFGLNVPFGLETRYPRNWTGRYHAVESELFTLNFSPVVAFDALSWLSVAAGLNVQYVDAELTNAIDFGTIALAAGGTAGQNDGFGQLTGDDIGFGFNLGLLAEPVAGTRLGIGFRSKIDHTLKGDADFTLSDNAAVNTAVTAGGGFADVGARARLETPASLNLGIAHDVTDKLTLMGEAQWTQWSSFDQLIIDFDNPAQADSITNQQWNDQWFIAAGLAYDVSETLGLRFGLAFDQSPVRSRFRTPRIADNHRYWLAAGMNWQPAESFELTVGFTHIFVDESDIRLRTNGADENTARGNLDADFDTFINILTLSGRLRF